MLREYQPVQIRTDSDQKASSTSRWDERAREGGKEISAGMGEEEEKGEKEGNNQFNALMTL